MMDADPSLNGLIGAVCVGAALDLSTMLDADTILNGLIRAIFSAATLDFGPMTNTHSTLYCLIITTVMGTAFDLGSMFYTHTFRLGLISAPIHIAIGVASFLSTCSVTLRNLGSMTLAHTTTD
jgi:hypothetical protein